MVEFAGFKCEVQVEKYQSGYKALRLVDQEDGQSVDLDELDSDEIAIKDYSENEGIYNALLNAGVITPKHRELSTGYVTVPVCKLTEYYTL
jgi:hypothetical protein